MAPAPRRPQSPVYELGLPIPRQKVLGLVRDETVGRDVQDEGCLVVPLALDSECIRAAEGRHQAISLLDIAGGGVPAALPGDAQARRVAVVTGCGGLQGQLRIVKAGSSRRRRLRSPRRAAASTSCTSCATAVSAPGGMPFSIPLIDPTPAPVPHDPAQIEPGLRARSRRSVEAVARGKVAA
jgi:hypothetical protein